MKPIKLIAFATILAISTINYAQAAEFWRCRFPWGAGTWEVEGQELIGPPADLVPAKPRYPIVRNTDEAIIAVTNLSAGQRYEVVTIDKIKGGIKHLSIGLEGDYEDHFNGTCVRAQGYTDNGN